MRSDRIGLCLKEARLDDLVTRGGLSYQPVSIAAWRQAAHFWADARQFGRPTAAPDALDADVLLAACAATIGQLGDRVIDCRYAKCRPPRSLLRRQVVGNDFLKAQFADRFLFLPPKRTRMTQCPSLTHEGNLH